jgi:hypothetical protein
MRTVCFHPDKSLCCVFFILAGCILLAGCLDFSSSPVRLDGNTDLTDAQDDESSLDTMTDGDPDVAPDVHEDTPESIDLPPEPLCEPGLTWCEGFNLVTCSDDGLSRDETLCPAGCVSGPGPHCGSLVPSNIGDASLLCAGSSGLPIIEPGAESFVLDTDTGSIDAYYDGSPTRVRPEGTGDIGGIVFTVRPQADPEMPSLGIFSFADVTVPAGFIVLGVGSNALVILSCGAVTVHGTISASPAAPWDPESRDTAGPGGGNGGIVSGEGGHGTGGGGPGAEGSNQVLDGGGGGGAFGGIGGNGGSVLTGAGEIVAGGMGGDACGSSELIPLMGGSGGGSGHHSLGNAAARGGGGGGALQLVSNVSITIEDGGAVDAGGAGGGGGIVSTACCGAGAGGGSGGGILLEAPEVIIRGAVTAAGGGGGGSARDDIEGGAGIDGFTVIAIAAGGAGSGAATSGGSGSDPASGAGSDGEDGTEAAGSTDGGGGGGGAGIIRINTRSGADRAGGTFHPSTASSLFSEGGLAVE